MSWEATAYVTGLRKCADGAQLSASQKFLLFVLSNYHNTEDGAAWPSLPRLAEDSMSSLSTVKRNLDYLEEHCLIERRERDKVGRHAKNVYVFLEIDDPKRLGEKLKGRIKARRLPKETVQNEPFFSPEKNGSETVHKRFINGSETVQNDDAIRNDPNPDPNPDPKTLRSRERDAQAAVDIAPDARHKPVERAIKRWYCAAFQLPDGSCPWTAKTGALLKQLLLATPQHWTAAMLERCAMHWIYSWRPCGIPDRFIPRLLDRYEAPLDQYGCPDYAAKKRCAELLAESEAGSGHGGE